MNLSGIVVFVSPDDAGAAVAALEQIPGVEVHGRDTEGRLIVVQESPCVEGEVAGLRRIQALPAVISAELVYHYFAEDPSILAALETGSGADPVVGAPTSLTG